MNTNQQKDRRRFFKNASLVAPSLRVHPKFTLSKIDNRLNLEIPKKECNQTTIDKYGQGPKYIEDAPVVIENMLTDLDEPGTRLLISGRIFNNDCSKGIANAMIDIWHCPAGIGTENDEVEDYLDNKHRGKTTTNREGFYIFETIKPGRHANLETLRPAHIHFKITPPNGEEFITQLYFAGDPFINNDPAASDTTEIYDASKRIIQLTTNDQDKLEGTWDVVLADETLGVNDLYRDKGMIYSISPNPFTDRLAIKYGVFYRSKVSLMVYDITGKEVAKLEERSLSPDKYEAIWEPNDDLPNGFYFITLKINDLQVHYMKTVRNR